MGCSKNLVDSERVMKIFEDAGYDVEHEPAEINGDEVVINTCGFIGDAKQESIDMILQCVEAKKAGKVGKVTVMGCLSERYRAELPDSINEVDRWFGKFDWIELSDQIKKISDPSEPVKRHQSTPRHFSYVKISEGCNRFCAFCAIPLITGRHKSRPIESILEEVRELVQSGVTEFNIIAQDLSSYGTDLYGSHKLADLVEAIALTHGVRRIRLHYAYPADFPMDVLKVMAKYPNVCNYLDIALQHISDNVLSNMRRHINSQETLQLIYTIRREVT
ncbi:MAG: radical SAM protein, partial [Muribaculaceae bacterium]|nr:radical SAM protein [Muribaculaceae bacterium]